MREWLAKRWGRGVPEMVIVHHQAGVQSFERENEAHRKKWNSKSHLGYYLGYHLFIERSGKIYRARNDWEKGIHTIPNTGKIGICLQGQGHLYDFTPEQYQSLKKLLTIYRWLYRIPVKVHRDFANTICPSDRLVNWLTQNKFYE